MHAYVRTYDQESLMYKIYVLEKANVATSGK